MAGANTLWQEQGAGAVIIRKIQLPAELGESLKLAGFVTLFLPFGVWPWQAAHPELQRFYRQPQAGEAPGQLGAAGGAQLLLAIVQLGTIRGPE